MKNYVIRPSVLSFIFLFAILTGCNWFKNDNKNITNQNGNYGKGYSDSELVVWLKPGSSLPQFKREVLKLASEKNLKALFCASCDSSLALLTGPNASKALGPVAQGATGGSGGTGGGPTEGAPGYYWMDNFHMNIKDPLVESTKLPGALVKEGSGDFSDGEVIVGVLDTGVDTTNLRKTGFLFDGSELPESCIGSKASSGWNFTIPNEFVNDDYNPDKGHGANVAWLIKEECRRFGKTRAKILPIKVIPPDGPATLYDVLCGLAYAKERGAKIINASLGYYSCDIRKPNLIDSATVIFGIYIREYLTKNNILLVAAGGNMDDDQQKDACGNVTRSLNEINFYPASFANNSRMKNVIAVTTISHEMTNPGSVSPRQNFSNKVIDIGVHADSVKGNAYTFKNTRISGYYIEGSSYATPIVAGIIAANYQMLVRNISDIGNKYLIIDTLISHRILKRRADFDGLIKGGNAATHY